MELKKRSILSTFTVLSLAAAVMMGFQYVGRYAYWGVEEFLYKNQEAGVFRWLFWLFHSEWTDTIVQYAFMLGAAYIPVYLMICWLPKDTQIPRELSGKDFLIAVVMAMGLGYVFNLIGAIINFIISDIVGTSFVEMNPVAEMLDSITPSMVIYTCFLGPFMEELLCRGFLLKRARVFGDWTAVVYTSVIFGMMHGNIAQFLYAVVIGLILGYVAVKTNSIKYTVWIHMVINTYNMVLALGEEMIWGIGSELLLLMYSLASWLSMLVLIIGGIVLMVKYARIWIKQMLYHNGPPSSDKLFVYMNPGFVIYLVLCLVEFMQYLM